MKKPSTLIPEQVSAGDVYALVKGLSNAERAAVRKMWGKSVAKKLPLHFHFFEQIAGGEITDDASARLVLDLSNGAQFSNLKQHLANEVLDALVDMTRDETTASQLAFGIMQMQLLLERSHTALARRLCKKLLGIAEEAGLYNAVLELLGHRNRLIEQRSLKQFVTDAEEVAGQIQRYTAYQHTIHAIQLRMDRLMVLRAADQLTIAHEHHESLVAILEDLIGLEEQTRATPHLRLRYLAAVVTARYMLQQFELCDEQCSEGLTLYESRPGLAGDDPESFLNISNISFYNEFARGRISGAADWLKRFDAVASGVRRSEYFDKRWAIIRFNTSLKVAHKTADFEAVESIVIEDGDKVIRYVTQVLPPAESLSVIASILISLFVLQRYDEAEELMIELKERNRNLERQDVFYFTLVFHLAILFELKDWYRLDTATAAAYHVLYNRKKLRPFEKELMSFLKALPSKRGSGGTIDFIKAFVQRLEVYQSDPVQRLYFLYFNYYDWLQSKLAGITYREYKERLLANALQEPV